MQQADTNCARKYFFAPERTRHMEKLLVDCYSHLLRKQYHPRPRAVFAIIALLPLANKTPTASQSVSENKPKRLGLHSRGLLYSNQNSKFETIINNKSLTRTKKAYRTYEYPAHFLTPGLTTFLLLVDDELLMVTQTFFLLCGERSSQGAMFAESSNYRSGGEQNKTDYCSAVAQ